MSNNQSITISDIHAEILYSEQRLKYMMFYSNIKLHITIFKITNLMICLFLSALSVFISIRSDGSLFSFLGIVLIYFVNSYFDRKTDKLDLLLLDLKEKSGFSLDIKELEI